MDCRVYLLIVALGVLLMSTDAAPTTNCSEEIPKQSRHNLRVAHRLQARGNTKQTVEDALNIPIAALEAVQRLLSNLFSSKTIEVTKS